MPIGFVVGDTGMLEPQDAAGTFFIGDGLLDDLIHLGQLFRAQIADGAATVRMSRKGEGTEHG